MGHGRSWAAVAGMSIAVAGAVGEVRAETPRVRGTYVRVEPPVGGFAVPEATPQGGGHLLFLNRCPGGATVSYGDTDDSRTNKSMIVTGSIHLNEYPFSDASWNQIVSDVRGMFSPFGINITDVDPGNVPHDEVFICGSDVAAGFDPAAGVAPFTCEQIPNAVTFVFPETIGDDTRYTSETVAQEAAHAWKLDHSFKCEDPMTYLEGCGNKSFQDADYRCGEYEARDCDCGDPTQNTYQYIRSLFGAGTPDTESPAVTIVSPVDGDEFDPGADFEIGIEVADNVEVSSVRVFVGGAEAGADQEAPFDGWPVNGIPAGEHEIYIEAEDSSGNVGVSNVVTVFVAGGDPDGDQGGSGGSADDDDTPEDEDAETDGEMDSGGGGGIDPTAPYPVQQRGDDGCACTSAPSQRAPVSLLLLIGLLGLRRRS